MLSNPSLSPASSSHNSTTTTSNINHSASTQHDQQPHSNFNSDPDLDADIEPLPPSSTTHLRPGKHSKTSTSASSIKGVKRVTARKWKRREVGAVVGTDGGVCHLFKLPEDVLHLLCTRLPPRDLQHLASTCRVLRDELSDESVWRQSFINQFFWENASRDHTAKDEIKVLVQGCVNVGARGWRKEALSREAMLDRWVYSNSKTEFHNPFHMMVVHSLSLSYPAFATLLSTPKELIVGKMHGTPTKSGNASPTPLLPSPSSGQPALTAASAIGDLDPASQSPSPFPKLTHRQKYEAMLAATTRPRPELFSACLDIGSVVKSDPFTGKISKGFWGPAADSNFYIHPHLDAAVTPTSMFMPKRSQTHILWGLVTGGCVYTVVQTRKHTTSSGRAASVNTTSTDAHQGAILDIWQPEHNEAGDDFSRWVTAGADGRVKYWQLQNRFQARPGGGKRTPITTEYLSSVICLFSSQPAEPVENRSEDIRLRQMAKPDDVIFARCNVRYDVVCGVTEDGDLRVWFDASAGGPTSPASSPRKSPSEFRLDVGSARELGGVKRLELDCRDHERGVVAIVMIHHDRNPVIARYDITRARLGERSDGEFSVKTTFFSTPASRPITAVFAHLHTTHPISLDRSPLNSLLPSPSASPAFSPSPSPLLAPTHLSNPVSMPAQASPVDSTSSSVPFPLQDQQQQPQIHIPEFGRYMAAGDEEGEMFIWAWDGEVDQDGMVMPIRAWPAVEGGKVTAIDVSCGLVAVGGFDGKVAVYDPLPNVPELLRSFTPPAHLSPADLAVAAGDAPQAVRFNVNQIILENDLIVASIGRRVMSWRAGTGKGRQSGKEISGKGRRSGGGKVDSKSHSRVLDMRALHQDAQEDQSELRSISSSHTPTRVERQHRAAMQDLGLEDGDDALQYALMLSRDEALARGESIDREARGSEVGDFNANPSDRTLTAFNDESSWKGDDESYEAAFYGGDGDPECRDDDDGEAAVRAVEAYERAEADDLAQMLEMIRIAEERDRRASAS